MQLSLQVCSVICEISQAIVILACLDLWLNGWCTKTVLGEQILLGSLEAPDLQYGISFSHREFFAQVSTQW